MNTLEWAPFREDAAIEAAYQQLSSRTDRIILLHPLSVVPKMSRPFWKCSSETIRVFVDPQSPTAPHSIVHELLHAILMVEGFHRLTGRLLRSHYPNVATIVSNELQHPEIFCRMAKYGLDMKTYRAEWTFRLEQMVRAMRRDGPSAYTPFLDYPQVFTWFFFPEMSARALEEYSTFEPHVHESARVAYEHVNTIGFSTARANRQSLRTFKAHWLQCCERLPNDPDGHGMIQAVKGCITKLGLRMYGNQSEERLLACLKKLGLQEA